MERVFDKLENIRITYKNFSHNPTFTCDEARNVEIPGKRVKSLVLNNKNKSKFFMIVLEDDKKLDTKKLQKILGESKLSFSNEERIVERIGVKIGHISPFAFINSSNNDMKVIFDKCLKDTEIGFHPLRNDNTTVLNLSDMQRFLENLGVEYNYLDL